MTIDLMPFIWVGLAIPILLLLQRWIHVHLHGISLLLTGKPERAVILYAIILLPGVFLHEASHWLAATFLGVRTGAFSLIPRRQADGSLQLGYVEYFKGRSLGPIRESLIGGAPLIVGTAVIVLIGYRIFDVTNLATAIQSGDADTLTIALSQVYSTNDFLVWLYLLFAISNAMMPSQSDRRAWPAFILTMSAVAIGLTVLGIQQSIVDGLVGPATRVFGYLGLALSMAIAVDLIFMLIMFLTEEMISRLKGTNVVYGNKEAPQSKIRL